MRWHSLRRFRDATVPKLHNLRRAAAAGLRVPATVWAPAGEAHALAATTRPFGVPLIVRSGSPTEDTRETSNAGQLLSLRVADAAAFAGAVERVVAALPKDGAGQPRGVVFVQPLVRAMEAGVAFFDGFYFERATAPGDNETLTSGQARGDVVRGHLQRADPWSAWLASVYRVFGHPDHSQAAGAFPRPIDVEFARDADGYVLLQARPALFQVARNETLSLANHKEVLGDPPSPWITSALVDAGRDVLAFWGSCDRVVAAWDEAYAVPLAERAWMNFSFFFRLMDHWGLPRSTIVRGVGGESTGAADERVLWGRVLRSSGHFVRLQVKSLLAVLRLERGLERLGEEIDRAQGLTALFGATVAALAFAIPSNFAIAAVLNPARRVRRALGVRGGARVVTQEMMERWTALAGIAEGAARDAAFDRWIAQYGHRGPLESDPARPRFAELRDVLRADLEARLAPARVGSAAAASPGWRALYWIDERREWFRDQMMQRWQRLRVRMLEEGQHLVDAGAIDAREDVFWLRGDDLALPEARWREAVAAAKVRIEIARRQDLPLTASRDAIARAMMRADATAVEQRRIFPGIALGPATVEGRAVTAGDLTTLLVAEAAAPGSMLGPDAILIVPALEPSWAVVFPRVRGVVAEIGGELSHASILLREAGQPAIVNCEGIMRHVRAGDRVRLDGARGVVEILTTSASVAACGRAVTS